MKSIRIVSVMATLVVTLSAVAPAYGLQPIPIENIAPPVPPTVSAEAWVIWDATYERELGSENADQERAMASTTKLMTAIVAVEHARMSDLVQISELAAGIGESEIGLVVGESVALGDLLAAILLESANDAAMAIAEHVGGSIDGFADMMNEQAAVLEMTHSHFVNPHGLDAPGHYSSANDLLLLGEHAMEIPELAEIVGARSIEISSAPDGTARVARTTNQMIGTYDGAFGIKTGYTDDAGLTLITGADRDGRRVFVVVMGSEDHFADASLLLNYAFREYQLLSLIDPLEIATTLRTSEGPVDAIPEDEVEVFASSTEADAALVTPTFSDGEPRLVVDVAGDRVGESALDADPPELPGLVDAFAWASTYWDWLWGRE